MESGKLRHLVTIQAPIYDTDEYGKKTIQWSEFKKAYAKILPASGKETAIASQYKAQLTHNIMIRAVDGLKENMRLVYGARKFEIIEIKLDYTFERSQLLKCSELKD